MVSWHTNPYKCFTNILNYFFHVNIIKQKIHFNMKKTSALHEM